MNGADSSEDCFLAGVRVIELADELGEYCGKVMAGLGADVVKVEPLGGEITRTYGPFYHDAPHPNRSLYFWHYNFGKRGMVVDLDSPEGVDIFRKLTDTADVVIDSRPREYLPSRGLGHDQLRERNQSLLYARISPFGDEGPWRDYQASDLIHLALGGVMMNCGYDSEPSGYFDTPPIAPQMWHSYHIAGEVTAVQIIAALNYRLHTGRGQLLSTSVHDAVSKNTETDLPDWIYSRLPHRRQTCRHSFPAITDSAQQAAAGGTDLPGIARTKDGRWMLPYRTYLPLYVTPFDAILKVLQASGMEQDLDDERYQSLDYLRRPEVGLHVGAVIDRYVSKYLYSRDLWRDGQDAGLPWAPLRRPEENLTEEHWADRETFITVHYPELSEEFVQTGAKWMAKGLPWRRGPRAPLLGEHTKELLAELGQLRRRARGGPERFTSVGEIASPGDAGEPADRLVLSKRGKPFALHGVRIIDLSWLLASGGAGRFFAAHGAEVIKVEHLSKLDGMRMGAGAVPTGGRSERALATTPIHASVSADGSVNRSGSFMEINAGKRSVSLNLKHPHGRQLLTRLIEGADIIIEGFSPGTMDRMGLGYDRLKEINPRIVYVQQSGMGQLGRYGRVRSFGPTAQAFSGLSEMSGLPDPWPPAGIGYSYLDWFGAYQMAAAMMAGLYRQRRTGRGCWIDSSQVEAGIYLTGTAILDFTVNGRTWSRYGNGSPYKLAAPHGVYRTRSDDRWIAIAAFTDEQWFNLTRCLHVGQWCADPRLATLPLRLANETYLDDLVGTAVADRDGFELMAVLQCAGVPAGVCQTAQDRYERDPQLAHLGWLVELDQSEIGRWPVKEVPVMFSETPPYIGGTLDRHGPSYGEDNDYVFREILGLSSGELAELAGDGVI